MHVVVVFPHDLSKSAMSVWSEAMLSALSASCFMFMAESCTFKIIDTSDIYDQIKPVILCIEREMLFLF